MGRMGVKKVRAVEEWGYFRENTGLFWKPNGRSFVPLAIFLGVVPYLTYKWLKADQIMKGNKLGYNTQQVDGEFKIKFPDATPPRYPL
jgi:hypothetical protein